MLVGNNYKIESDALNITLYKKHFNKKQQRDEWHAEAYFATIRGVLNYLVKTGIRQTELKDLKDIDSKIEELHELIDGLHNQVESMVEVRLEYLGNIPEVR